MDPGADMSQASWLNGYRVTWQVSKRCDDTDCNILARENCIHIQYSFLELSAKMICSCLMFIL